MAFKRSGVRSPSAPLNIFKQLTKLLVCHFITLDIGRFVSEVSLHFIEQLQHRFPHRLADAIEPDRAT